MRRRNIITLVGGTAATWPLAARPQQPVKTYQIAILTHFDSVDRTTGQRERYWTAFLDELRRLGYEEGRNLAVTWHSSQVEAERVAELARSVAERKPDAIFTPDARMGIFLKTAAAAIPVVAIIADPVGSGVAASLARPGRNVTGFSVDAGLELIGKRLELFRQAVPMASRMAWLTPRRTMDLPFAKVTRETVRLAGMTLVDAVLDVPIDAPSYRRAFASMTRDGVDSLWVGAGLENLEHRRLIADLAADAKLPSMLFWRENVEAGGLIAHGPDLADIFRRSASYIDRILKGANPSEMPFQQPNRYDLVINLKTARALGLTIPPSILALADEVID